MKSDSMENLKEAMENVQRSMEDLIKCGWIMQDFESGIVLAVKAVEYVNLTSVVQLRNWLNHLVANKESFLVKEWIKSTCSMLDENKIWPKDCETIVRHLFSVFRDEGDLKFNEALLMIAGEKFSAEKRKQISRKENIAFIEQAVAVFNEREREVWYALNNAKFYVPGEGEKTAFENVEDPVGLCIRLAGKAFPNVRVDLIFRLAAWTTENKQKAKRKIGAFLLNRFSASQDRNSGSGYKQQQQEQVSRKIKVLGENND